MQKLMSCGVLIFRGNPIEEFLLMEHANRLDLPKGHVDDGETELECALRELQEETGIRHSDIDLNPNFRFEHHYHVRPKWLGGERCRKTLVIFLAELTKNVEIELTEHQGYAWHRWNPPHRIQKQTIDPLLSEVADFLDL